VDQLDLLGFRDLKESDYYGPSLALGAVDVTLWDLANGYRSLANSGVWRPLRVMSETTRNSRLPDGGAIDGTDILDASGQSGKNISRKVLSPETAFILADILSDRESRSMTFSLESPLATRFWTAVKTGTSKDMRDNWCVGFSSRYTVGVWVGNFSGAPMRDVSGITGAAPIWQDIMSWLHRDLASPPPAAPPGVVGADSAFTDAAEPARREWFLDGTEPPRSVPVRSRAPRIIAPTDGAIIAIDPDIPAPRQRVAFTADPARPDLRWVLDGSDVGPAAQTTLWRPVRGRHRLSLIDAQARPLGEVRFEVRGPTT